MINTTFELSHVQICIRHIYQAAATAVAAVVALGGTSVVAHIKRHQRGVRPPSSTHLLLPSERGTCILKGGVEKRNCA